MTPDPFIHKTNRTSVGPPCHGRSPTLNAESAISKNNKTEPCRPGAGKRIPGFIVQCPGEIRGYGEIDRSLPDADNSKT